MFLVVFILSISNFYITSRSRCGCRAAIHLPVAENASKEEKPRTARGARDPADCIIDNRLGRVIELDLRALQS